MMTDMENFDYLEAIKRLEEIAVKVEDPDTGLEAVDRYLKEADALVEKCRSYLRTVREKVDALDR